MSATTPKRGFWAAYVFGGLTVLAAALLWQGLGKPPAAYGQVPDSGAQRNEMINELRHVEPEADRGGGAAARDPRRGVGQGRRQG